MKLLQTHLHYLCFLLFNERLNFTFAVWFLLRGFGDALLKQLIFNLTRRLFLIRDNTSLEPILSLLHISFIFPLSFEFKRFYSQLKRFGNLFRFYILKLCRDTGHASLFPYMVFISFRLQAMLLLVDHFDLQLYLVVNRVAFGQCRLRFFLS